MPTYITLWNYTQEGIENIEDHPTRTDEARNLIESLGGEVRGFYLTMGRYDYVSIVEFPDDDAAAKYLLRTAQVGAASSQTLKAWPEADYLDLLADLP